MKKIKKPYLNLSECYKHGNEWPSTARTLSIHIRVQWSCILSTLTCHVCLGMHTFVPLEYWSLVFLQEVQIPHQKKNLLSPDPFHIAHIVSNRSCTCPQLRQRIAVILVLNRQFVFGKIFSLIMCQVPALCRRNRFNCRSLKTPELSRKCIYIINFLFFHQFLHYK